MAATKQEKQDALARLYELADANEMGSILRLLSDAQVSELAKDYRASYERRIREG